MTKNALIWLHLGTNLVFVVEEVQTVHSQISCPKKLRSCVPSVPARAHAAAALTAAILPAVASAASQRSEASRWRVCARMF